MTIATFAISVAALACMAAVAMGLVTLAGHAKARYGKTHPRLAEAISTALFLTSMATSVGLGVWIGVINGWS